MFVSRLLDAVKSTLMTLWEKEKTISFFFLLLLFCSFAYWETEIRIAPLKMHGLIIRSLKSVDIRITVIQSPSPSHHCFSVSYNIFYTTELRCPLPRESACAFCDLDCSQIALNYTLRLSSSFVFSYQKSVIKFWLMSTHTALWHGQIVQIPEVTVCCPCWLCALQERQSAVQAAGYLFYFNYWTLSETNQ